MARYRLPDGSIIEAPDGLPKEAVQRYVLSTRPGIYTPPEPEPGFLGQMGRAVQRGYQLGEAGLNIAGREMGLLSDETAGAWLAENLMEAEEYAPTEAVQESLQEIQEAGEEGPLAGLAAVVRNPAAVANVAAESLGRSAPALAALIGSAALKNRPGMRAGAALLGGGYSGVQEYGSSFLETMQEFGIDPNDPTQIQQLVSNPEALAAARKRGLQRGIPISLFDAMSIGMAGRVAGPVYRGLGGGKKAAAAAGFAELGLQVGAGMGGEAAATAATGEPQNWGELWMEGAAELGPGTVEILTGMVGAKPIVETETGSDAGEETGSGERIPPGPAATPAAPVPLSGAAPTTAQLPSPAPGEVTQTPQQGEQVYSQYRQRIVDAITKASPEVQTGKQPSAAALPKQPLISRLKAAGGVSPQSILGEALRSEGVTPTTAVGLYRRAGIADDSALTPDALGLDEQQAGAIGLTDTGTLSVEGLTRAVRQELSGQPLRTIEQDKIVGQEDTRKQAAKDIAQYMQDEWAAVITKPPSQQQMGAAIARVTGGDDVKAVVDEMVGEGATRTTTPEVRARSREVERLINETRRVGISMRDLGLDPQSMTNKQLDAAIEQMRKLSPLGPNATRVQREGGYTPEEILPEGYKVRRYAGPAADARRNIGKRFGRGPWAVAEEIADPSGRVISRRPVEMATSPEDARAKLYKGLPEQELLRRQAAYQTAEGEQQALLRGAEKKQAMDRSAAERAGTLKTDEFKAEAKRQKKAVETARAGLDEIRANQAAIAQEISNRTRLDQDEEAIPELGEKTTPNPEIQAFDQKLGKLLADRAEQLNLGKLGAEFKVLSGMQPGVEGTYQHSKRLITLSRDMIFNFHGTDKVTPEEAATYLSGVMDHEVIHALYRGGRFKPKEWQTLTELVGKTQRVNHSGAKTDETYLDWARSRYSNASPEGQVEEAIADIFRSWASGNLGLKGQPRGIFMRVVDLFRKIVGLGRSIPSLRREASKILKEIEAGSIAERTDAAGRPLDAREKVASKLINTDTKAFRNWFKDSVVRNPDGTPKVMYHSTDREFSRFKPISHFGTAKSANERMEGVRIFNWDTGTREAREGENVVPAYLSIQNPLDLGRESMNSRGDPWENDNQMFRQVEDVLESLGQVELAGRAQDLRMQGPRDIDLHRGGFPNSHKAIIELLEEAGYDGFVYENALEDEGSTSYVAFRPQQIKSVFNSGNFDSNDVDILASLSDLQAERERLKAKIRELEAGPLKRRSQMTPEEVRIDQRERGDEIRRRAQLRREEMAGPRPIYQREMKRLERQAAAMTKGGTEGEYGLILSRLVYEAKRSEPPRRVTMREKAKSLKEKAKQPQPGDEVQLSLADSDYTVTVTNWEDLTQYDEDVSKESILLNQSLSLKKNKKAFSEIGRITQSDKPLGLGMFKFYNSRNDTNGYADLLIFKAKSGKTIGYVNYITNDKQSMAEDAYERRLMDAIRNVREESGLREFDLSYFEQIPTPEKFDEEIRKITSTYGPNPQERGVDPDAMQELRQIWDDMKRFSMTRSDYGALGAGFSALSNTKLDWMVGERISGALSKNTEELHERMQWVPIGQLTDRSGLPLPANEIGDGITSWIKDKNMELISGARMSDHLRETAKSGPDQDTLDFVRTMLDDLIEHAGRWSEFEREPAIRRLKDQYGDAWDTYGENTKDRMIEAEIVSYEPAFRPYDETDYADAAIRVMDEDYRSEWDDIADSKWDEDDLKSLADWVRTQPQDARPREMDATTREIIGRAVPETFGQRLIRKSKHYGKYFRYNFLDRVSPIGTVAWNLVKGGHIGEDHMLAEVSAANAAHMANESHAVTNALLLHGKLDFETFANGGTRLRIRQHNDDGSRVRPLVEILTEVHKTRMPEEFQHWMAARRVRALDERRAPQLARLRDWHQRREAARRARLPFEEERPYVAPPAVKSERYKELDEALNGRADDRTEEMRAKILDGERIYSALEPGTREIFDRAARDIGALTDANVDAMFKAGLIKAEERDIFLNSAYIPFHKAGEDLFDDGVWLHTDENKRNFFRQSAANVKRYEKRRGSSIGEGRYFMPMEMAFADNFNWTINSILRNDAYRKTIRDLQMANDAQIPMNALAAGEPVIEPLDSRTGEQNVVTVLEDGVPKHYKINDPLMYESMAGLGIPMAAMNDMFFGGAVKVLRESITRSPPFILANMLRDSVQAWVVSGESFIPVVDTLKGFWEAYQNGETAVKLREAGVGLGYERRLEGQNLGENLRRETAGQKSALRVAWDWLERLSSASDMATRIAVYNAAYKRLRNQGMGDGEARMAAERSAREILNFGRHGAAREFQFLLSMVPFLNARIQGLDVLGRSLITKQGQGIGMDPEARYRWATAWRRMAYLTALGALYTMTRSGEDWYEDQQPEVRDDNYLFNLGGVVLAMPAPFEVGVLTKTLPEHIIRTLNGDQQARDLRKASARAVFGTFGFNPVPQLFMPTIEAMTNYDMYFQRPITPVYQQQMDPSQQYSERTSGLAHAIAATLNVAGEWVSPNQVDHIIRGHTGTLGTWFLTGSDQVLKAGGLKNSGPQWEITDYPFMRRFLKRELGSGQLAEFYDLQAQVQRAVTTVNRLKDIGQGEEAREIREDRANLFRVRGQVNAINQRLRALRKRRQDIERDQRMSAVEKRNRINKIREDEKRALRNLDRIKARAFE